MTKQDIRLLGADEDYQRLGIKRDTIEVWEDGRRLAPGKGHWEWWYFDAIMDDGMVVTIQFMTKNNKSIKQEEDTPLLKCLVTTAEGVSYEQDLSFELSECSIAEGACDVRYGQNRFFGDLSTYQIRVVSDGHVGCDLKLTSTASPYRPETGIFELDNDPEKIYTWFCTVPGGIVEGTVELDGKPIHVNGTGYHDHQWGTTNYPQWFNNWVWARQNFGDYFVLVFDYVSSRKSGAKRIPIVFVEDKNGQIVYSSTSNVKCRVEEEQVDPESGKDLPVRIAYKFWDDAGKSLTYRLTATGTTESKNANTMGLPKIAKALMKAKDFNMSYTRHTALGEMELDLGDGAPVKRSGDLIYEFMYPGNSFHGVMDTEK